MAPTPRSADEALRLPVKEGEAPQATRLSPRGRHPPPPPRLVPCEILETLAIGTVHAEVEAPLVMDLYRAGGGGGGHPLLVPFRALKEGGPPHNTGLHPCGAPLSVPPRVPYPDSGLTSTRPVESGSGGVHLTSLGDAL